jgi:hypothetical protein
MIRILQKLRFFLLAGVLLFMVAAPVRADENFGVSLHSIYTVTQSGSTVVEQRFTLTNKKPTLFAKQYAIEFGSGKLKNVRVYDDSGTLPANVVTGENKTSIGLTFNDKIVGEGKTRTFTIQFETPDATVITGNVLEVYVPKLTNAEQYDSYDVTLRTPLRYGRPVRVSPQAFTLGTSNAYTELQFQNLGKESVSALFGEKQVFHYTLRYDLENSTNNIGIAQIALPPDTSRQKMEYFSLEPKPKEINRDADGNWIATYEIAAEKTLNVELSGKAVITLEPSQNINLPEPTHDLLQEQKFWETQNTQITELSKKYSTPKDIYHYVVSTLTYNYKKVEGNVERMGALAALNDPTNAACQEFTDLFIAMSRAAGVPARRATGYAYTENNRLRPLSLIEDILHAWPEYYDAEKKDWVPVDPTWGNTTGGINYFDQFDFNHLVFAINGTSSTTPYSAGAYKLENQQGKNVFVEFGTDAAISDPSITKKVFRKPGLLSLFTNRYILELTNNTGAAVYSVPVQIVSNKNGVTPFPGMFEVDYLLPFQKRTFEFRLDGGNWFQPTTVDLTVSVQGLSSSHALQIGFTPKELLTSPIIAVGLGACLVIIALLTWSLLVSRRPRQRPLRR